MVVVISDFKTAEVHSHQRLIKLENDASAYQITLKTTKDTKIRFIKVANYHNDKLPVCHRALVVMLMCLIL